MNTEKYDAYIRMAGQKLIKYYEDNESGILCGINGPYDDPETKVRNLCHLIVITAIEGQMSGEEKYKKLLSQMGEELLSKKQDDGLYCMREKKGKDNCNGVIGHAWLIEALIYLWKGIKDDIYLREATDVARRHEFQTDIGLWGRPNMGCTDGSIDYTLNHQIWFAASLCELNQLVNDELFEKQLNVFMNNLHRNLSNSRHGKVSHEVYRRLTFKGNVKCFIKRYMNRVYEFLGKKSMAYKEAGYHMFNIMALARIYSIMPTHSFFKCTNFKRAINYISDEKFYLEGLLDSNDKLDRSLHNHIACEEEKRVNIYGYPYNVPGFEIMYVYEIMEDKISDGICEQCLNKQFEITYNEEQATFGKGCHDKNTIKYRIYEYYRYLEIV